MRITNTMMVNNSIANIAVNKDQVNTLNNQLSTQKKISRPSEDPIIAIRALRLRSNLSQVSEYLEKNIPDADSWLSVTQGALEKSNDIVSDLYKYCNQGSTDTFATTERDTIVKSLNDLKESFYSEGNVDYAGRFVFTGYKTDSSLTYMTSAEATSKYYTITQNFSNKDITTKSVISNTVDLTDVNDSTVSSADIVSPSSKEVYKLTLGYSNISGNNLQAIKYNNGASSIPISSTTTDPNYVPGDDEAVLNTSTGELLLGKNVYKTLQTQSNISFTYDKSSFSKGDVKPEQYFTCIDKSADITADKSNSAAWTSYQKNSEDIEYTVNYAQTIKVNTQADEAFNINLGRDVDELSQAVQDVTDIETKLSKLKSMKTQQAYSDTASQSKIDAMITATNKEYDLANNKMQSLFEKGISKMQGYQQQITNANADVGNRITRLELTKSRLTDQQTNFKDLKSKNEDIELEDVAVNYSAAELVYNASLSAASKVVKQSLLDFL